MKVFSNGFVVYVPRFGIEGVIRAKDMLNHEPLTKTTTSSSSSFSEGEITRFDADTWTLEINNKIGTGEWLKVELFDKVKVRIWDEKEVGTGKRRVRMGLVGYGKVK